MKNEQFEALKFEVLQYLIRNNNHYSRAKVIIASIPDTKGDQIIRKMINKLRQEGWPIISSNRGYQYSEDLNKIFEYNLSLKGRIIEMVKAYDGLSDYYNANKGERKNIERFSWVNKNND